VEQYDLDVVDDEEAPFDALQRMVIGDVRPHDLSESQASHPQMILLHPHKIMSNIKRMNIKMNKKNLKTKIKFMIKRKALINGR
jgi:hypothetical protein